MDYLMGFMNETIISGFAKMWTPLRNLFLVVNSCSY